MDLEAPTPYDSDRAKCLPGWPVPAGFLAYFVLFHHFANAGQIIPAMVFGFIGVPVFIAASVCCIVVLVRLLSGAYQGRLSWPGLLAWVAVATLCVTMAALVLR